MSKKNKKFIFSSKAKNINQLKGMDIKFKIPKFIFFTHKDWRKKKREIIKKIKKSFNTQNLIIRSSSIFEDTKKTSNAGKYLSVNNVKRKSNIQISKNIERVFKSYEKSNKFSLNEIIVQESITNISMSGVVFTHEIENGAPYYSINYDDQTNFTDTVTSGSSEYSNRTLYIYRNQKNKLKSKRFKKLIECVKDLEKKLKSNFLDIEFGLTKDLKCYIFQVRPITKIKKWDGKLIKNFENSFVKLKKRLSAQLKQKKRDKNFNTVFGQMPDWNPAEMIGKVSKPLSSSLYKTLITENTWSDARLQIGYFKPIKKDLMETFFDQPYIDTKLSFESFTPYNIKKNLRKKIVNHWLESLRKKPYLHDKIEFDVAITCYSFDINKKINSSLKKSINSREREILIKEYFKITNNILKKYMDNGLQTEISKIEKLKLLQDKFRSNKGMVFDIKEKIYECKQLGTLPFSILARYAFIADTFIKSLVNLNIISKNDAKNFYFSIKTIASDIATDIEKYRAKNITENEFFKKYGHLRPGTYDICSKRYDESSLFKNKKRVKRSVKKIQDQNFNFTKNTFNKIDLILKKNSFNLSSKTFVDFIKESIKAREYAKFIFTKSISDILEKLQIFFKKYRLSSDDISYLEINDILRFIRNKKIKELRKKIAKNKEFYQLHTLIKLPLIFTDFNGLYVIPFQINAPNFITNKQIQGEIIEINNLTNYELKNKISGKIVLIEGADPGYDWIFSFNIKALITKFGGANSHMSIRCAEFGLPAAIGCGEQIFHKLKSSNTIFLNCETKKIEIIH